MPLVFRRGDTSLSRCGPGTLRCGGWLRCGAVRCGAGGAGGNVLSSKSQARGCRCACRAGELPQPRALPGGRSCGCRGTRALGHSAEAPVLPLPRACRLARFKSPGSGPSSPTPLLPTRLRSLGSFPLPPPRCRYPRHGWGAVTVSSPPPPIPTAQLASPGSVPSPGGQGVSRPGPASVPLPAWHPQGWARAAPRIWVKSSACCWQRYPGDRGGAAQEVSWSPGWHCHPEGAGAQGHTKLIYPQIDAAFEKCLGSVGLLFVFFSPAIRRLSASCGSRGESGKGD